MNQVTLSFEHINHAAMTGAGYAARLARWFPAGKMQGREFVVGDLAGSPGGSLSINTRTGEWADFSSGERGGDPVSLYAAAFHGGKQVEAAKALATELGIDVGATANAKQPRSASKPTVEPGEEWFPALPPLETPDPPLNRFNGIWTYRDATGARVGYVVRLNPTEKRPRKIVYGINWGRRVWTDDKGQEHDVTGWHNKHPAHPMPLYGLELLAARPDAPVLVVEGEKACDAARAMFPHHVCVTWPRGVENVAYADWTALAGRWVIIWPDNDPVNKKGIRVGIEAAAKITHALAHIAENVVTLNVDDLAKGEQPDGEDAADITVDDPAAWLHAHMPSASEAAPMPDTPEDDTVPGKPYLFICMSDLPESAQAVRSIISASGSAYDRGRPVRIVRLVDGSFRFVVLTHHAAAEIVHIQHQPATIDKEGQPKAITLPERLCRMWLESGDWGLPEIKGFAFSPLLGEDGKIRVAEGYDPATKLWCCGMKQVFVPDKPTRADADAALLVIRKTFATFPFKDAIRITGNDLDLVDTSLAPSEAESAFLHALLTAVCRVSLDLAPGSVFSAPEMSGSGSGKGLLVKSTSTIAFGSLPAAFTTGNDKGELDKRIASELLEASPVLFLDNVNNTALKSDTLASVITENPCRVRVFGETRMALLNSAAWIAVTGNGLSMSEDLVRRFIVCELDPGCEDPEAREFPDGAEAFVRNITARRRELLTEILTIWRWGRQNEASLKRGKPFGSFETWARWIRDPLLALGCPDPVERISRAKQNDPQRARINDIFEAIWENHHDYRMTVKDLHDDVKAIIDPQGRGRQFVAAFLGNLNGTRAGGFVLTRQEPVGKHGVSTFKLSKFIGM